ncbi:MAG: hypothetical protein ACXU86_20525 [Archangium sp.]
MDRLAESLAGARPMDRLLAVLTLLAKLPEEAVNDLGEYMTVVAVAVTNGANLDEAILEWGASKWGATMPIASA